MDEKSIIEERRKKLFALFKGRSEWIIGIVLAAIVGLSIYVRTRGLSGLRDVTTGGWTLGPDLDPFLFLRWAKYIVAHGSLMANDTLRYVPIGFNTSYELVLLPYSIAWFHKIATIFGSTSVEQSTVLFPVFVFALTVIALFFLARKIFLKFSGHKNADIIALVSSFFLTVGVSLLPRTIAGIPEKENGGFLFLCASLALFLYAWEAESKVKAVIWGLFAGASTALMAHYWGGYTYLYAIIGLSTLLAFLFGQVTLTRFYAYSTWVISAAILTVSFTIRYSLMDLASNPITGIIFFTLGVIVIDWLLFSTSVHEKYLRKISQKIPSQWFSVILTVILALLGISVLLGPSFIINKFSNIFSVLVQPIGDRLGVTVAENRQPYFGEWSSNFGPIILGFPIYFWIFIIGSIYLAYMLVHRFDKKERLLAALAYSIFLFSIVFSRYSPSSLLNGENLPSLLVYVGGTLIFAFILGRIYFKRYKANRTEEFSHLEMGPILLFMAFIIGVISARGAVRLAMLLVPSTSIIVGYFVVDILGRARKADKDNDKKMMWWFIAGLVFIATLYSGYQMYVASTQMAAGYVPNVYTQQWQQAMAWVRSDVPQNAVFAHWWDYGYWVQSIGERATMLDGGNQYPYWNYLMGRYGLTGTDSHEAATLFYTHNVTNLLIDSSDIGKYTAFSSIGSDDNYDRRSWISPFTRDATRTVETKNSTMSLYVGGFSLDEDIVYEFNGTKVFLPGLDAQPLETTTNLAGLGGITVGIEKETGKLMQPNGVFVYGGKQYVLPIRYAFYNGTLIDFGTGIESGVFFMTMITPSGTTVQIDQNGALLYLSKRVVNSQLARLYLFEQNDKYFTEAHVQDDYIVATLKANGAPVGHFVYYQGFRGPITIWNVTYSSDIVAKPEYLSTVFPKDKKFTI